MLLKQVWINYVHGFNKNIVMADTVIVLYPLLCPQCLSWCLEYNSLINVLSKLKNKGLQ